MNVYDLINLAMGKVSDLSGDDVRVKPQPPSSVVIFNSQYEKVAVITARLDVASNEVVFSVNRSPIVIPTRARPPLRVAAPTLAADSVQQSIVEYIRAVAADHGLRATLPTDTPPDQEKN